jgi:hypothetical protein
VAVVKVEREQAAVAVDATVVARVVQGLGLAVQVVQIVVLRPGLVRSHTATMGTS